MREYMVSLESRRMRRAMMMRNMVAVGSRRLPLELVQLAVAYVQRA